MAKIKNTMTVSLEEFGKKAGEYALDEFEYKGLTIRQWADKIANGEYQPVKHGRWEVNGDRFYPFCSNCKYKPPKELIRCSAISLEPILTKYCPNCGFENGTRIYRGGENNG